MASTDKASISALNSSKVCLKFWAGATGTGFRGERLRGMRLAGEFVLLRGLAMGGKGLFIVVVILFPTVFGYFLSTVNCSGGNGQIEM